MINIDEIVKESKSEIEVSKVEKETGVVLEAYFGKKPNILKMEKAFDDILAKYGSPVDVVGILASKELRTIKDCIKAEFGFKDVGITITPNPDTNAMTLPVVTAICDPKSVKRKKMIESSRDGFRFKDEANMDIMIIFFAGMFDRNKMRDNPGFTGAELTAVILHEIGHNFTCGVSKTYSALIPFSYMIKVWIYVVDIVNIILNNRMILPLVINTIQYAAEAIPNIWNKVQSLMSNVFDKKIDMYIKDMKKTSPLVYTFMQQYLIVFTEMMNYIQKATTTISNMEMIQKFFKRWDQLSKKGGGFIHKLSNMWSFDFVKMTISSLLDPLGYLDERFADNFAAIYGYAPELTSALNKLSYVKRSYDQYIPIVGHCVNIIQAIPLLVVGSFDEHPSDPARYKNMVRQLEKELENPNIDADTKKIIKKQIKEANKEMDKLFKDIGNIQKMAIDPSIVNKTIRYVQLKVFGGDVRHNIQGNSIYKDIDDKVYGKDKK